MDGCFDFTHWGHANALRQGKGCGDILVVGVHSDAAIRENKGPPVMSEWERYTAVRACKWVDEVVEDAPYYTDIDFIRKYDIDIVVHGDDVSVGADGTDTYAAVKEANMFRTVPRTLGVSTTDIVGRMLLMQPSTAAPTADTSSGAPGKDDVRFSQMSSDSSGASPYTRMSTFLPSANRILQFSEGREATADDRVIYVDGVFDLFHVGHIEFLRKARELGTYLIVGVVSDAEARAHKGPGHPIMSLHERVLGVLSCRYVDEVIIEAPWSVSESMLRDLRVHSVAIGDIREYETSPDPYAVARTANKLVEVKSGVSLTSSELIERIIKNRMAYAKRNAAKEAREVKMIETK
jgi:ethanolamine-phosphate cytidylyltransferase